MKLLIDCRAFVKGGSSVSVYTYNLVNNLIKKNQYVILVINNKNYIKYFEDNSNVDCIYCFIQNNILWDNIVIPYYSIVKKVDIILYTKGSSCWFKIPKKKIVTTIHGMIYRVQPEIHGSIENNYWRLVGKIASIITDKIIVVSNSDKKDLIAEGYNPDKMCVIPIGVSSSFFLRENYGDSSILDKYNLIGYKYFVHLGHITKKKNQKFTISLVYEILKNYPDFKLVFIGNTKADSNYFHEITNYISYLGIAKNIIFTGVIDQNSNPRTIPTLMNKSKCVFFPSTYEGFGMPAVEAIAAGTPILASDRGSLPEVLGKENVIPLEEKQKWLEITKNLMEDINYRNHLISMQQKIIENYKWENIADQYLKFFNSMVGEKV